MGSGVGNFNLAAVVLSVYLAWQPLQARNWIDEAITYNLSPSLTATKLIEEDNARILQGVVLQGQALTHGSDDNQATTQAHGFCGSGFQFAVV